MNGSRHVQKSIGSFPKLSVMNGWNQAAVAIPTCPRVSLINLLHFLRFDGNSSKTISALSFCPCLTCGSLEQPDPPTQVIDHVHVRWRYTNGSSRTQRSLRSEAFRRSAMENFCYADLCLSSKCPVVACEPVSMTTTIWYQQCVGRRLKYDGKLANPLDACFIIYS